MRITRNGIVVCGIFQPDVLTHRREFCAMEEAANHESDKTRGEATPALLLFEPHHHEHGDLLEHPGRDMHEVSASATEGKSE